MNMGTRNAIGKIQLLGIIVLLAVMAFFVKQNGNFSTTKFSDRVVSQAKVDKEDMIAVLKIEEKVSKETIEQPKEKQQKEKNKTSVSKTIEKKIIKNVSDDKVKQKSSLVKNIKDKSLEKKEKKTHYKSNENTLNITIPTPPKVPVAIKVVTNGSSTTIRPREVRKPFSTSMPVSLLRKEEATKKVEVAVKEKVEKIATTATAIPTDVSITPKEVKKVEEKVVVANTGATKNGRVSAYLRGDYMDVKVASKNLTDAGFKILSTSSVDKKGLLTTIVFTNDKLTNYANKKDRGFNSTLRVLVDKSNKQITITNSLYFARAYMQDDFDKKVTQDLIYDVNKAFSGLKTSKDKLKYTLLPKYQFMFSMPYYEDMIDVAKASSNDALVNKLKKSKSLVFSHKLSNNRELVGVNIRKETSSFIDIVGYKNALLLPYPILLENGVAKILSPKYYIAVSYPMLKMSQFMKISSVPDEIEKDCKNLFSQP